MSKKSKVIEDVYFQNRLCPNCGNPIVEHGDGSAVVCYAEYLGEPMEVAVRTINTRVEIIAQANDAGIITVTFSLKGKERSYQGTPIGFEECKVQCALAELSENAVEFHHGEDVQPE